MVWPTCGESKHRFFEICYHEQRSGIRRSSVLLPVHTGFEAYYNTDQFLVSLLSMAPRKRKSSTKETVDDSKRQAYQERAQKSAETRRRNLELRRLEG